MLDSRKVLKSKSLSDLAQLSILVKENNLDEIKNIANKLKNDKHFLWEYTEEGYVESAMRDAIIENKMEIVKFFLQAGVSKDDRISEEFGDEGFTYVYWAALSGNIEIIELLKTDRSVNDEKKVFVNDGLCGAVMGGQASLVEYFLKLGAYANRFCSNNHYKKTTLLEKAVNDGNTFIIELLINYGASINTTLHYARKNFNKNRNINKHEIDYTSLVKNLLDYAFGFAFEKKIKYLDGLDITDFNFIGISVNEQPITHEMLDQAGLKGADKAIVTLSDLNNIEDESRKSALKKRLDDCIQQNGKSVNELGIVNLVPLYHAAENGDTLTVQIRLAAGINPNGNDKFYIPIIPAAKNGYTDVVKVLAEHPLIDTKLIARAIQVAKNNDHINLSDYLFNSQNINIVDCFGDTYLHIAVKNEDIDRINDLIDRRASVNIQNLEKETPLILAAKIEGEKGTEIVKKLLDNGANANLYQFISPLKYAMKKGNIESIALLLPHTEKKEIIRTEYDTGKELYRDPWYLDLVFEAIELDNYMEMLHLFKNYGVNNFNIKEQYGSTLLNQVLHIAFYCKPDRIDTRPDNHWCLSHLSKNKRERFLEEKKRDRENKLKEKIEKALDKTSKLMNFLLDNDADINYCDNFGKTPLHTLIEKFNYKETNLVYMEYLKLFITKNANLNAQDRYGDTPLHIAVKKDDLFTIDLLNENKAEINIKNNKGNTPLHKAAELGSVKSVELLLQLGANIQVRNNKGLTPLELFEKYAKNTTSSVELRILLEGAEKDAKLRQSQNLFSTSSASTKIEIISIEKTSEIRQKFT